MLRAGLTPGAAWLRRSWIPGRARVRVADLGRTRLRRAGTPGGVWRPGGPDAGRVRAPGPGPGRVRVRWPDSARPAPVARRRPVHSGGPASTAARSLRRGRQPGATCSAVGVGARRQSPTRAHGAPGASGAGWAGWRRSRRSIVLPAAAVGTWLAVDRSDPARPPAGCAETPRLRLPVGRRPVRPARAGPRCPAASRPLPERGRCPGGLECYGRGQRDRRGGQRGVRSSCVRAGTSWEVFAAGDLPGGRHRRRSRRGEIQQFGAGSCATTATFRVVSLRLDKALAGRGAAAEPGPAFGAGDRTYRCLAGRGPTNLPGPTLSR